jgi:hypothetical protein
VKMGDYVLLSVAEGGFLSTAIGGWRGVGFGHSVYQTCPVPVRLWGAD